MKKAALWRGGLGSASKCAIVSGYGARTGGSMRRVAILAAGAVALAGCAQKPIAEMSFTERQALADAIVQRCVDQGYGPDNSQHVACLRAEADREIAVRQAGAERRQAAGVALAAGAQTYGNSLQASRPVTCTSTPYSSWVGGRPSSVTTTCY